MQHLRLATNLASFFIYLFYVNDVYFSSYASWLSSFSAISNHVLIYDYIVATYYVYNLYALVFILHAHASLHILSFTVYIHTLLYQLSYTPRSYKVFFIIIR